MKLFPRVRNLRGLAALLVAATLLPGCIGYRVGSMLPPDIRSVFIPTFTNETDEPLIESEVTRRVVSEVQRDGSLRVVSQDQADAILRVALRRFILNPVAYDRSATATRPNEYRIILSASYVLVNAKTGKVISEHPAVEGEALAPVVGDLSSSKRVALPEASRKLAIDIVAKIVETW